MNKPDAIARPGLVVLVLIALLMVVLLSPPFTGWFSNVMKFDIGIAEERFMCLYFVEKPTNAIQDSEQNISIDATNCGSTVLDGKVVVEIRDKDMNVVDTINSSNYSLSPSQYFLFSTKWKAALPLGNYWMFARDENDSAGSTNEINASFNITCETGSRKCFGNNLFLCTDPMIWDFMQSCSNGCRNGECVSAQQPSGGVSGGGGIVPVVASISLDYRNYIETAQESEYTFLIKVTNNGSVHLHNLTIHITAKGISAIAENMEVEELLPGNSIFFVINISVPDVSLGNYSIDFEISSAETSAKGNVVVSVLKKSEEYSTEEKCNDIINYYIDLTGTLNREIIVLEAKGNNVTELRKFLSDAVREIDMAKEYRDMGLFDSCIEQNDVIRRKIERVADAIAVISTGRKTPEKAVSQPIINIYLVYVIIAAILIIILIIGIIKMLKKYLKKRRLMMIEGKW